MRFSKFDSTLTEYHRFAILESLLIRGAGAPGNPNMFKALRPALRPDTTGETTEASLSMSGECACRYSAARRLASLR